MGDKALALGHYAPSGLVLYPPYVPIGHDVYNTYTVIVQLCIIHLSSFLPPIPPSPAPAQPMEVIGATPTPVWRPFASQQTLTSFWVALASMEEEASTKLKSRSVLWSEVGWHMMFFALLPLILPSYYYSFFILPSCPPTCPSLFSPSLFSSPLLFWPLQLLDLGEEGGQTESDGTVIASQNRIWYTCEQHKTCRSENILFFFFPLSSSFFPSSPPIYQPQSSSSPSSLLSYLMFFL